MGLKGFERRLERLVEGTFAKAFRSGVEPVEIGRKIVRAVDAGRTLGVSGHEVAPNQIVVYLSPGDLDHFESYTDALARDLAEAIRTHAKEEGYRFIGPVSVALAPDDALRAGDIDVAADLAEGEGGRVGSLVLPDGARIPLGEEPAVIGRLPDCAITLNDARASRHHAEVRPHGDGFVVVDLGSMNGTTVNGVAVKQQELADGDVIGVGSTNIGFEAS
ncbi:MAG TPA: DUF3662 and FHA domain-containing protein [Acidimicrobiia bacterium]|nr:DUF3662 and FHA domain-containing protein [Acidimicrobiia bacterium]